MTTFIIDNQKIKVDIHYKPSNKKSYLKVKDGVVVLNTNKRLSNFEILDILEKHSKFINKVNNVKFSTETIHFLGYQYKVEIINSNKNLAYTKDDIFYIELTNLANAPKIVEIFYINSLKKIVEIYAEYIINKFDINPNIQFKYSSAKSFYGKCIKKQVKINNQIKYENTIILCSHLAKYELKYVLSVIYHECAHFKYPNHQKEYYNYLEKIYPGYKKVQHELRQTKYNDIY